MMLANKSQKYRYCYSTWLRFNLDSAAKLNFEIRSIKSIEHQQLIDLWLECGLTRSWNNPEKDIQRKLSFQPDLLLGAFHRDQLAASWPGTMVIAGG